MGDELLGGRYRLEEVLGSGGMATVWRALDTRLGRPVAVKTLNSGELSELSAAARFDREARTVARLSHPNIVSVYDGGTHDGTDYIVMELVDGVTVASMLAEGPLPIDRAVSIARQTTGALGAAHATGIVHRDVKPVNIMVTPAGTVKVCDFGIARELQASEVTLTAPHTAIGTAAYMAPEQAVGDPVDARTDLYALGCVMYAMLTGAPPFTGDRPIEVLYQQLHNVPQPLRSRRPDVPPALDALVTGLLAKNPADRPADAAAVRAALDQPYAPVTAMAGALGAVAGAAAPAGANPSGPGTTRLMARATVPTPVRPDGPNRYPAGPARPRRRVLGPVLAAAVIALLVVAAVLIASLLDRQRHDPQAGPPPSNQAPTAPAPTGTTPASTTPASTGTTPAQTTTSPSPTDSATSSTSTSSTGSDPVGAVRTVLQQEVATGQIDPGAARDLSHQLDDIDHSLAEGNVNDAQQKIGQMRDHLGGLVRDGKLSQVGYVALAGALDALAAGLPPPGGG
jgi:serine/threonine-protein kinase